MREQLISLCTGLASTLIVLIASSFWPNSVRPFDSILMGCLAYAVSTLAITLTRTTPLADIPAIRADIGELGDHVLLTDCATAEKEGSFSLFWTICLIRARHGLYKTLSHNAFAIPAAKIPIFWQQAILAADYSWDATNVVRTSEMWVSGWSRRGLDYHSFSIADKGVLTRRVFLYRSRETITERDVQIMAEHRQRGIRVKWTTLDNDSLRWASFDKFRELIATVDFVIVDGKYVLAFDVSEEFDILNGVVRCFFAPGFLDDLRSLYNHLWEEATELSELLEDSPSREARDPGGGDAAREE